MNRVFLYTLVASVLVHLLLALLLNIRLGPRSPLTPTEQEQTNSLNLSINYQQEQDESPPPPEHNTDDPTEANQQQGTALKPKAAAPKSEPTTRDEIAAKKAPETPILTTTGSSPESVVEQTAPQPDTSGLSTPLSDSELDDTLVESPLDQQQEALKKWYNEVYKRLTEQVMEVWVKPDDSDRRHRGVIRLEVDINGYLNRAWVHLPSGHRGLDQSALNAVRSIIRYQLPESPNMARYYLNMDLRYSGGDDDVTDSLPSRPNR